MLAPGSLRRTFRDALGELLDESAEPVDLGQPLVEPFGAVAVFVGPLLPRRRGRPAGDRATGPSRERRRPFCEKPSHAAALPGKPFACRLGKAAVGREGDHRRALQVAAEQVEQGERAPAERQLGEWSALVDVRRQLRLAQSSGDQRAIGIGLPVGDHHLVEGDPVLARPPQACAKGVAHLSVRIGRGGDADRPVCRVGRRRRRDRAGAGRGPGPLLALRPRARRSWHRALSRSHVAEARMGAIGHRARLRKVDPQWRRSRRSKRGRDESMRVDPKGRRRAADRRRGARRRPRRARRRRRSGRPSARRGGARGRRGRRASRVRVSRAQPRSARPA